jgi:hypothetical protein
MTVMMIAQLDLVSSRFNSRLKQLEQAMAEAFCFASNGVSAQCGSAWALQVRAT